jgi:hypothetical protein
MDKEYINSGALFATKVKKNPKSPDYFGDVLLDLKSLGIGDGKVKLRLSGWKKETSKGTFLALSVQPFQDQEAQPVHQAQPAQDDDIPF